MQRTGCSPCHICNRFDFHGLYGRLEHLLHFCFSLVFAHACGFFLFFLIFTFLFQFYYNYNLLLFSLSKSLEKGTLNQTSYLFLILSFFISCAPSEIAYFNGRCVGLYWAFFLAVAGIKNSALTVFGIFQQEIQFCPSLIR